MTSGARAQGWYRCIFCGTANGLPWSEAAAQDGPASSIVLLRQGEILHFVIPPGTLFLGYEAGFVAFALASVGAMISGMLEMQGMGALALAPAAAALWGTYWGVRRHLSEQHLELEGGEVCWHRSFRGRRLGAVRRSFDGELPMEGAEVSSGRYRVRLFPQDRQLDLLCSGTLEGKWLEAHLVAAASAAPPAHACPGCAAPLDLSIEQRGRGHVDCAHCRTGFVTDGEDFEWAPLVLPDVLEPPQQPGRRVQTRPRGWIVDTRPPPFGAFRAAGLTLTAPLLAGMGAAMTWLAVTSVPPLGLAVYMLLSGPALVAMALAVLRIAVSIVAARVELRIDGGTVHFEKRVGRLLAAPPTLVPRQPGDSLEQMQGSLPLRHLVEVRFDCELGQTRLAMRTPTRELLVRWTIDGPSDLWLRARIVDKLRERLLALGREVR